MARYFLDSSALIKRYHHESGSTEVEGLFNQPGNRFFVSRLALCELHSAFARLVREAAIPASDFPRLIARLEQDVATGIIAVAAVSSRRLDQASSVLATLGFTHAVRTLDAIHLATAQALHRRNSLAALVAADKKLLSAASAGGLAILEVG